LARPVRAFLFVFNTSQRPPPALPAKRTTRPEPWAVVIGSRNIDHQTRGAAAD